MRVAKYLPTKKTYKNLYLTIFLLLFTFILDNLLYKDSIITLVWLGVILFLLKIRRTKPLAKLKYRRFLNFWAMYFGVLYLVINILAGLIDGLGRSPYNHSLYGIVTNLIVVGTALIGRELIRSHLINGYANKDNMYVHILVSILMTVTSFPIIKYLSLSSFRGLVQFLAQYWLPDFSRNIFASYLVYLGGPITSIIYLVVLEGFHWLSPILPNLKWITSALIGILTPIFFMMILNFIYLSQTKQISIREESKEKPFAWIVTSIVSVLIIWFALGVFPIYPSVIATGSMEPMIKPGDVILVKKVRNMDDISQLEVGNIIQYKRDNILISHRIVEIINDEEEGLQFRTKGDNNSAEDIQLVKVEDVRGRIEHTIPKIGWPTLLIKSKDDIDIGEVEF